MISWHSSELVDVRLKAFARFSEHWHLFTLTLNFLHRRRVPHDGSSSKCSVEASLTPIFEAPLFLELLPQKCVSFQSNSCKPRSASMLRFRVKARQGPSER